MYMVQDVLCAGPMRAADVQKLHQREQTWQGIVATWVGR
jgi:hypothetical protein